MKSLIKRNIKQLLVVVTFLFITGCSNVNYKTYVSNDVYKGKGGTIREVNGIDIWENGSPNRKYKIIGIIDYDAPSGAPYHIMKRDDLITEKCISYNCDALILINANKLSTGSTYVTGNDGMYTAVQGSRLYLKFQAIEYVD